MILSSTSRIVNMMPVESIDAPSVVASHSIKITS